MKPFSLAILLALFSNLAFSQTRFEQAKKEAIDKKELIVLNFSGSDWCVPCIKLHKNIIETEVFKKLISDHVVVYLNADFPRNKKKQPAEAIKKENAELAELYNLNGVFPYTLLLDAEGKVLKTWEGLPAQGADAFTAEIRNFYNNKH